MDSSPQISQAKSGLLFSRRRNLFYLVGSKWAFLELLKLKVCRHSRSELVHQKFKVKLWKWTPPIHCIVWCWFPQNKRMIKRKWYFRFLNHCTLLIFFRWESFFYSWDRKRKLYLDFRLRGPTYYRKWSVTF